MIVEYIRYRVPGESDEFQAAYQRAADPLRRSPHCLAYELTRCVDEPDVFVLRIEWTSKADHLDGFRKSPEFRGFLKEVGPFVARIEEMRHYERTDVLYAAPGQDAGRS